MWEMGELKVVNNRRQRASCNFLMLMAQFWTIAGFSSIFLSGEKNGPATSQAACSIFPLFSLENIVAQDCILNGCTGI